MLLRERLEEIVKEHGGVSDEVNAGGAEERFFLFFKSKKAYDAALSKVEKIVLRFKGNGRPKTHDDSDSDWILYEGSQYSRTEYQKERCNKYAYSFQVYFGVYHIEIPE